MHQGTDISVNQWRRGLPFRARTAMLKQGIEFLIARASIGLQRDAAFATTRSRSGPFAMFGAYHYLTEQDPILQAHTFLGALHDTGTVKGVSAALDIEDDNTGPILNHPTIKSIEAWVKEWRSEHPAHPLGCYTNRATWFRLGNPDISSMGFDWTWQALYPGGVPPFPPQSPLSFGGEGRAPMWQYGPFHLAYNGRHLSLDGDAWYGTLDELKALAGDVLLPPIPDRPRYKAGYNELIDRTILYLGSLQVPDPGSGPAWEAGVEEARLDASDALHKLRIGG